MLAKLDPCGKQGLSSSSPRVLAFCCCYRTLEEMQCKGREMYFRLTVMEILAEGRLPLWACGEVRHHGETFSRREHSLMLVKKQRETGMGWFPLSPSNVDLQGSNFLNSAPIPEGSTISQYFPRLETKFSTHRL